MLLTSTLVAIVHPQPERSVACEADIRSECLKIDS